MSKKNKKKNANRELRFPYVPELLTEILFKTQDELKGFCKSFLKSKGYHPINRDGYLYAEGDIPVMLVAHMDTVHKECVDEIFISNKNNISSPQGIGGDDRCGVYSILSLIENTGFRPYIVFTEDEEIGCVGAEKFARQLSDYDIDINFIIEIDRKGANDAVYYECENLEFEEFISDYGFKTNFGSFSDISVIAPELGVAAVNLSSGYYNAHTTDEFINLDDLNATIYRLSLIVSDVASGNTQKYEYVEALYSWHNYYNKGQHSVWDDYDYDDYNRDFNSPYSNSLDDNTYIEGDFCPEDVAMFYEEIVFKDYINVFPLDLSKFSVMLANGNCVDEIGDTTEYFVDCKGQIYWYLDEIGGLFKKNGAVAYSAAGVIVTATQYEDDQIMLPLFACEAK